MSDTFTKRHGYGPCAKELIYKEAPKKLRIGLWNLIQDYIEPNNLPNYTELYLKLTSFFRLERDEYSIRKNLEKSKISDLILIQLAWYEILDLIEYLFTLVVYIDYDQGEDMWREFPEHVSDIRYKYTVNINNLFSSENIGWHLKKGKFEREGSEYLDKEIIERVKTVLKHPDFKGPNNQFVKAINFFNKRPKPDIENCVKEAVGALEGVARILLRDKNITLGKAVDKMIKMDKMRKPFDKILHVLYGIASTEPGSRHGAFELSNADIAEANFVLYNSAACMLFLCDKFGYKLIEEEKKITEEEVPF